MLGRIHLITDSRPGRDPVEQVRTLLPVATPDLVVQFRPHDSWTDRAAFEAATAIVELCRTKCVKVLINDRVDIAVAVDADGAHVGADDLPVPATRRLLGPERILGATARTPAAARLAMSQGADYVGVGPCYFSSTKHGLPEPLGPQGVAAIAPWARVIAIGGVTHERVPDLLNAGAHGVAVIAAVADAADPMRALASLLELVR
ncbi:MAG TPA: thiamine phosphate synthase [Candidatus Limnocylindrales bacterium]|nr:thiamine phosphate synthase [Candidatus Limnocylindrales bacterium]